MDIKVEYMKSDHRGLIRKFEAKIWSQKVVLFRRHYLEDSLLFCTILGFDRSRPFTGTFLRRKTSRYKRCLTVAIFVGNFFGSEFQYIVLKYENDLGVYFFLVSESWSYG